MSCIKLTIEKGVCMTIVVLVSLQGFYEVQADPVGRLFTTPKERRMLEQVRHAEPEKEEVAVEVVPDVLEEFIEEVEVVEERPVIEGITVQGLVYRKNGRNTAWVNNSNTYEGDLASQHIRVDPDQIDEDMVQVTIPEYTRKIELKVGQTYDPGAERIVDLASDEDATTGEKPQDTKVREE